MTAPAAPAMPVYGHDWAVSFLRRSLINGRTRHAYLISGPANIGKNTFAHTFAAALNCEQEDIEARPCGTCASCRKIISGNHPDILYPELDERSGALKIDHLRDLMRLLALKPFSSRYRIAIMHDFHLTAPRVQDALLKTLEEPSPHAILILLAETTETILPTIISRCQLLPLRPAPLKTVEQVLGDHFNVDEEQAKLLARLSGGRIGWALHAYHEEAVLERRTEFLDMLHEAINGNRATRFAIAADIEKQARKDKNVVRYVLELWLTYWRDLLMLKQDNAVKPCNIDRRVEMEQITVIIAAEDALRALQATRKTLLEVVPTNANIRMALEVMFLQYPYTR